MAINKMNAGVKGPAAKQPVDITPKVLKRHEKLLEQLVMAQDPNSDGGMIITRPELKKLRKGLDRAQELSPDQRAQIEQTLDQADSFLKLNEVVHKVREALDQAGAGGKTITAQEAAGIIKQAEGLPAAALKELKTQVLHALTAQDHWDAAPDARQAFASFLNVPVDKLPLGKATQSTKSAAFTKAHNEARPRAIPRGEFKEIMGGMKEMPPEVREMCTASVLGAQKDGLIKLDPESRKVLTRSVATGFAEGPEKAMAHREESSLMVGAADSYGANYLAQVLASGGSFEEILFAFMLLMAGKAEKEAEDAMEQLAGLEKDRDNKRPGRGHGPGTVEPGSGGAGDIGGGGNGGGTVGTVGGSDQPSDPADVKKAAKVLESMVQSAHHATTDKSDGGTKITSGEAKKLVSYLERLPENVQQLLAGSLEKALQIGGVPLTGNAHFALDAWASERLGRPLDIESSGEPGQPPPHNSELAKALRESDKLEDKVASFIVDSMYKPDLSLKEKMEPFKSLRMDMASAGNLAKQTHEAQPMSAAEKVAKAGGAAGDLIAAAAERDAAKSPAAAAAVATEANEGSAADDFVLRPQTSVFSSSMVPEIDYGPDDGGGGSGEAEVSDGKPGMGNKPTKIQAQHRLQMAMNNRQRVLDMLSNIMKAIHDTQMTAIRNLR